VVDDEQSVARILQVILESLGYRVTVRSSSAAALEMFAKKPGKFDLVITDLTMPNMTGDRLAAELLRIQPDIPIILCTGYGESGIAKNAEAIGIREIAKKPFDANRLAGTVRRVLDKANES